MRLHIYIMSLICILNANVTHAQQLEIRSGDHPTFSRLTIPIPADQPWEAVRTSQGVELLLPEFAGGFSVENVFQRISRDRIESLEAEPSIIRIIVNCPCDSTAFRSGPLVVIDIADQGAVLDGPKLANPKLTKSDESSQNIAANQTGTSILPWIGGTSPQAFRDFGNHGSWPKQDSTAFPVDTAITDKVLDDVQNIIAKEVGIAASVGLLEQSNISQKPQLDSPKSIPSAERVESTEFPDKVVALSSNMRIKNSMVLPREGDSVTVLDMSCPVDNFLAVHTWGDNRDFALQIGIARNELMNARDQLDINAAINLAQLYIYFGFGAETLNVLSLHESLATTHSHLIAIASILEKGSSVKNNTLQEYISCDSDVALWASLSLSSLPSGSEISINAALRALNKLPEDLRRIIAPILSDQLLQFGDAISAATALRSLERLPRKMAADAMMAKAELSIDSGQSAEVLLENLIQTNSIQSPAALVKLVEGKLTRDEPLSYEIATLVEAYVQELRGTELGSKLRQIQVIALSQSLHFQEAFDSLQLINSSLPSASGINLLQTVLQQLEAKADDLTFLEHTFGLIESDISKISDDTKLLLASRLMDLGFSTKVQQILAMVPNVPHQTKRQMLAGKAALSLRQPYQAQAALIGIEGSEAELIRAQAKELAGSYSEAAELFSNSEESMKATQAAWLSEDWRDLVPSDTPGLGPMVALSSPSSNQQSQDLGQLGLAKSAVNESSAARTTLKKLLNDPATQADLNF